MCETEEVNKRTNATKRSALDDADAVQKMMRVATKTTPIAAFPRVASSTKTRRSAAHRYVAKRATLSVRAVNGDDDTQYVKPVQEENALLESEEFSVALQAGFGVFVVVCIGFVLNLASPVVKEMIDTFPTSGGR